MIFAQAIPGKRFRKAYRGPSARHGIPYARRPRQLQRGHPFNLIYEGNGTRTQSPGVYNLATYTTWSTRMIGGRISLYYPFGSPNARQGSRARTSMHQPRHTSAELGHGRSSTAGVGKDSSIRNWNEADSATYYTGPIARMSTAAPDVYSKKNK